MDEQRLAILLVAAIWVGCLTVAAVLTALVGALFGSAALLAGWGCGV